MNTHFSKTVISVSLCAIGFWLVPPASAAPSVRPEPAPSAKVCGVRGKDISDEKVREGCLKTLDNGAESRFGVGKLSDLFFVLGRAQLSLGDPAARASLARSLELMPGRDEVRMAYGYAEAAAGRPQEAARAFDQISRASPGFAEARLARGKLVAGTVNAEALGQAIADFEAAINASSIVVGKKSPARPLQTSDCVPGGAAQHSVVARDACAALADALRRAGDLNVVKPSPSGARDAAALYEKLIPISAPSGQTFMALAKARELQGEREPDAPTKEAARKKALDAYQRAADFYAAASVERQDIHRARARLFTALGRHGEAAAELSAVTASPADAMARARALLKDNRRPEAALAFEAALSTTGLSASERQTAYLELAGLRDRTQARNVLNRAMSDPAAKDNADIRLRYAAILVEEALAARHQRNDDKAGNLLDEAFRSVEPIQTGHTADQRGQANYIESRSLFEKPLAAQTSTDRFNAAAYARSAFKLSEKPEHRVQLCRTLVARQDLAALSQPDVLTVCKSLGERSNPDAMEAEGAYFLRRARIGASADRTRHWESAYNAFSDGLGASDALKGRTDLRARLKLGLAQAQYCMGLVDQAQTAFAEVKSSPSDFAAGEDYLKRFGIELC